MGFSELLSWMIVVFVACSVRSFLQMLWDKINGDSPQNRKRLLKTDDGTYRRSQHDDGTYRRSQHDDGTYRRSQHDDEGSRARPFTPESDTPEELYDLVD